MHEIIPFGMNHRVSIVILSIIIKRPRYVIKKLARERVVRNSWRAPSLSAFRITFVDWPQNDDPNRYCEDVGRSEGLWLYYPKQRRRSLPPHPHPGIRIRTSLLPSFTISCSPGDDIFVHQSDIINLDGFRFLTVGQTVQFECSPAARSRRP